MGLTTGVAGLLGLPFPNGLIPQAPFHTESLCVTKVETDTDAGADERSGSEPKPRYAIRRTRVVEQRASNLAQGLLTLGTMTGPLLVVLHLIPQAVLAGHLHVVKGPTAITAENGRTGYAFTTATTGGAAYAIAIGTKPRRDATVTLVTYREGRPVGVQWVSLSPLGEFTVAPYTTLEYPEDEG